MSLTKEQLASFDYVESVADTADDKKNIMWHGWALREAFLAGIKWKEAHNHVNAPDDRDTGEGWGPLGNGRR